MDSLTWIAALYAILTGAVMLFQLSLAVGAPWGAYAMGGKFPGRFPPAMRIAALLQCALLGLFGLVVCVRAGLLAPRWYHVSQWAIWVVVAMNLLSTVLNAITPNQMERRIWLPVALTLLVTSLVIARAG